jgi:uncharacterized RDD family membrane protein YckC
MSVDQYAVNEFRSGQWVPMAGWGRRAVARVIDSLVQAVGLIPYVLGLAVLFSAVPAGTSAITPDGQVSPDISLANLATAGAMMFLGGVLSLGIWVWNRVLQQGRTGQSVGKSVMKIVLVSSSTGEPPGAGTAFVREVVHVVDEVLLLGYLWPLWDPRRQTFADKILGTVVASPTQQPAASPAEKLVVFSSGPARRSPGLTHAHMGI